MCGVSVVKCNVCMRGDEIKRPNKIITSIHTNSVSSSTVYSSPSSTNSGRLPGLYLYECVEYANKEYIIMTIQYKKQDILFILDKCNIIKILNKPWHLSSGKYIATTQYQADGTTKEIYIHNLLMDINVDDTSESRKYVIHLNNQLFDNRIENLRIVDSAEYYLLKNKRKRSVALPEGCGILADDLPKYVTYIKSNGEHGDRFAIEIPKLNIYRKLTSSKKVPLQAKLEEAKQILDEIYVANPDVNPNKDALIQQSLNDSYNQIIQLRKGVEDDSFAPPLFINGHGLGFSA